MLKAYDTLLQTDVLADSAAINNDNEAFRYECLCCGEEVFLAAQDSKVMATHFRHKSGNNDKNCELYLGQYGSIHIPSINLRKKQERVEFYYDNLHKAFYMAFCFNEFEINSYEKSEVSIEVRDLRTARPFLSKTIDHMNFCDSVTEMFMIERYTTHYYISNTSNNIKREYCIFSDIRPTFFKIQGDGDDYKAKYIKSNSLYTNVKYFVAWPGQNTAQLRLDKIQKVLIEDKFKFSTMNNCTVWGMVVTFQEKSVPLDAQLQSWGYNLSVSEKLTLLWPPAYAIDEMKNISLSKAYLFSSFMFQCGNINISNESIHRISDGLTQIDIREKVKILKKNAEMTISINDHKLSEDYIEVEQINTDCFVIPENGVYYLFSSQGVEKLKNGQKVYLTPTSYIAEYKGNYLTKKILMQPMKKMSLENRISDALSHYWVMTTYDAINSSKLPKSVQNYLSDCHDKGYINQAVRKVIEEEQHD